MIGNSADQNISLYNNLPIQDAYRRIPFGVVTFANCKMATDIIENVFLNNVFTELYSSNLSRYLQLYHIVILA